MTEESRNKDIFTVSPFLSDDVVRRLSDCPYHKVLVTRKASVTPLTLECFDSVYITKDILNDNEYGIRQDIHAKLYYTTTPEGNYLYIGSANASHNAFYKNVEFLLKLKYKPRCVGFQTFSSDFLPDENCPYEKIEVAPAPEPPSSQKDAIDKAFKEAIYAVNSCKVIANVDTYNVEIAVGPLKTELKIKISPLQRPDIAEELKPGTVLRGLLLKELSEFYILTIENQHIVIKLETFGIPVGRDNAVYKSIIDSKAKFLSYVSFMLSENYKTGILDAEESLRLLQDSPAGDAGTLLTAGIYEKMLRVLHQNPSRLTALSDVVRRLDLDIVGDEFLTMYHQFELVARRLKK